MMRALVLRQLRHHAALFAGVCVALFGFELLMVWIGATMDMGSDFEMLLQAVLPESMQRLIMDQLGLASFGSAVAFGFKHPLVLVATMAVIIVLASIPAAERENGMLELVLARPLTRTHYLAAHVVLLLCAAALFPAVLVAAAAAGIAVTGHAGPVSWRDYVAPAYALAPLLLLIGAYTLAFAAGARRRGSAVAPAVGLTLVFYVLEFLASLWAPLDGWSRATIFDYYRPVGIITGEVSVVDPLVLLGLAALVAAVAFARFERQQL
jgi:ABC-2 type transport system permease protein